MRRRTIYILIALVLIVVVGFVLVQIFSSRNQNPPDNSQQSDTNSSLDNGDSNPSSTILPPSEQALVTGQIVVEGIGTYSTQDEFFRNFISVESYVTENLYAKFQAIINRQSGVDRPAFDQTTRVLGSEVTDNGLIRLSVRYEVEVINTDSPNPKRAFVDVELVNISDQWYVDKTSQIP